MIMPGGAWRASACPCPATGALRALAGHGLCLALLSSFLVTMAGLLRRLFPETIFARKLEPAAERRLRLAQARAEESIVRAHVDNALMFVDTLAEDLSFDRAIDTYVREMSIPEPLASTVATRTLVVLGQDLVPYRRRAQESDESERPKLRLGEASEARERTIKRA